jgi:hypothetical protein
MSEELSGQAEELQNTMGFFHIDGRMSRDGAMQKIRQLPAPDEQS